MNDDMKPIRVFVYGTLKEGYGNHYLLSKETVRKVGEFVTKGVYGLAQAGFPYLIDRDYEKKLPVLGEVYETKDLDVVRSLDILEGVAHGHYRRDPLRVISLKDGGEEIVQAYIAETDSAPQYGPCETTVVNGQEVFEWT